MYDTLCDEDERKTLGFEMGEDMIPDEAVNKVESTRPFGKGVRDKCCVILILRRINYIYFYLNCTLNLTNDKNTLYFRVFSRPILPDDP